mmetsp:Transcript_37680/g.117436  ORF Transcript_37680/g.117436 Transcript_37680/m.117436 type:complete len:171 (-) Transcript_37680:958-1470(-)
MSSPMHEPEFQSVAGTGTEAPVSEAVDGRSFAENVVDATHEQEFKSVNSTGTDVPVMDTNVPVMESANRNGRRRSLSKSIVNELLPITFSGLSYTVGKSQKQKTILCNLDGVFQTGRLCALMGPSGCGKTTLIDVISGRKTAGTVGKRQLRWCKLRLGEPQALDRLRGAI